VAALLIFERSYYFIGKELPGIAGNSENFHAIVPQDALRAQSLDENLEKITKQ
jgi:hypothetical protein